MTERQAERARERWAATDEQTRKESTRAALAAAAVARERRSALDALAVAERRLRGDK